MKKLVGRTEVTFAGMILFGYSTLKPSRELKLTSFQGTHKIKILSFYKFTK